MRAEPSGFLVAGGEGMGKTTLLRWAHAEAEAAGALAAFVKVPDAASAPPSFALRRLASKLRDRCAAHGLSAPAALIDAAEPIAEPGATTRSWLAGFADGLEELSAIAPVILLLDDIDNLADPMLQQLTGTLGTLEGSLAVVGSARHAAGADTAGVHFERITLTGLEPAEVADLIRHIAGAPAAPSVLQRLHELGEGNPLWVSELVRHLMEAGRVQEVGGYLVASADEHGEPTRLPVSLADAIRLRIDRLSPRRRRVLTFLALSPRPLDVTLLSELLPEPALHDELVALEAADLVRFDPACGFTLAHSLHREALRATIGPGEEAFAHRALYDALEAARGSRPGVASADAAYHAVRASPPPPDVEHVLWDAARDAGRGARHREAAHWYQALGERARSDEDADRALRGLAGSVLHFDPAAAAAAYDRLIERAASPDATLLAGRAAARRKMGDFQRALEDLRAARPHAPPDALFNIRRATGVLYAITGRTDAAIAAFEGLLAAAANDDERAMALGHLGMATFLSARVVEGHGMTSAALDLASEPDHRMHVAVNLCWMKIVAGRWSEADALLRSVTRDAERSADLYNMAALLTFEGRLAAWRGDLSRSFECASRAVALTERLGNPADVVGALDALGLAYTRSGQPLEAVRILERIDALLDPTSEPREFAFSFVVAGDAHLANGDKTGASAALRRAAEHLADAMHLEVALDRLRAEILLLDGEPAEARALLTRWLEEPSAYAYEQARAMEILARAGKLVGARRESVQAATRARESYESLALAFDAERMTPWIQAPGRGRPRSALPYGLTPRELEILWLITQGKTSKEIARALVISEGTVRKHVENVKLKASVSRRTELVTFATRLGVGPDGVPELLEPAATG